MSKKMDIKWCIPSFDRAGSVKTLDYLHSLGIESKDIYIFVQCERDFDDYRVLYEDKAQIFFDGEGYCTSDNRNNILNHFPEKTKILMLDDDIKYLGIKQGKKLVPMDADKVMKFTEDAFKYIEEHKALIYGCYPVSNGFFMSNSVENRMYTIGCWWGIITNDKYRFNNDYKVRGDIEFCLQMIRDGLNSVRFNFIAPEAQHFQKGGCKRLWDAGEEEKSAKRMLIEYSDIIEPVKGKRIGIRLK